MKTKSQIVTDAPRNHILFLWPSLASLPSAVGRDMINWNEQALSGGYSWVGLLETCSSLLCKQRCEIPEGHHGKDGDVLMMNSPHAGGS